MFFLRRPIVSSQSDGVF
uniref:Uncharacterized protein n=1 Tax=Anguilla anguilla TaxID=7936 RepID=A0A0E9VP46_ANGAN